MLFRYCTHSNCIELPSREEPEMNLVNVWITHIHLPFHRQQPLYPLLLDLFLLKVYHRIPGYNFNLNTTRWICIFRELTLITVWTLLPNLSILSIPITIPIMKLLQSKSRIILWQTQGYCWQSHRAATRLVRSAETTPSTSLISITLRVQKPPLIYPQTPLH